MQKNAKNQITNSIKVTNVEITSHINMPFAFNAICVWAYIYAQRVQRVKVSVTIILHTGGDIILMSFDITHYLIKHNYT